MTAERASTGYILICGKSSLYVEWKKKSGGHQTEQWFLQRICSNDPNNQCHRMNCHIHTVVLYVFKTNECVWLSECCSYCKVPTLSGQKENICKQFVKIKGAYVGLHWDTFACPKVPTNAKTCEKSFRRILWRPVKTKYTQRLKWAGTICHLRLLSN